MSFYDCADIFHRMDDPKAVNAKKTYQKIKTTSFFSLALSLFLQLRVHFELNLFLSNVLFWSPWKHQKTFGFLVFSGRSKGNIRKKRVNFSVQPSLKLNSGENIRPVPFFIPLNCISGGAKSFCFVRI